MGRLQRTHRGPAELRFKHVGHLLHEYTWPPELACPLDNRAPRNEGERGVKPATVSKSGSKAKGNHTRHE